MKKILALLLLMALFSSCNSPLENYDSNSPGQVKSNYTNSQPFSNLSAILPDTLHETAWQRFKTHNGNNWRIRWSNNTGLPVSVWSGVTKKAYNGNPEQAASSFLADYQTLFGFTDLNQLKYIGTETHRGVSHVTFNQTVHGVPVYEAEYKVHIRQDGHVDMANGYYYPNIQVLTTPGITAVDAVQKSQTDLQTTKKQLFRLPIQS